MKFVDDDDDDDKRQQNDAVQYAVTCIRQLNGQRLITAVSLYRVPSVLSFINLSTF